MKTTHSIPVHVFYGKHGTGKTRALQHTLKDPQWETSLVLLNQHGNTPLAHVYLLKTHAETAPSQHSTGCPCCHQSLDFRIALKTSPWRFSRGGTCLFKQIIVETETLLFIETVLAEPDFSKRFALASVHHFV